jgi:hypothetical protein
MRSFFKKPWVAAFLFTFIFINVSFFYQHSRHSKMTLKVVGQIYGYYTDADAHGYYEYRYYYNNKKYFEDESATAHKPKDSLIGKCVEVLLNPENPESSCLNFEKEIDCKQYEDSKRKNSVQIYNPRRREH